MKLKTKNILTLRELDKKELADILELAIKLKKEHKKGSDTPLLKNKTLAMIFQKPSTRTRVSFEAGMFQLGGYALNLSSNDLQLSRGETIGDTAKTLSRYVNAIMARVYEHEAIEELAKNATVPVINGLSNSFHPCQILADLMTIKEKIFAQTNATIKKGPNGVFGPFWFREQKEQGCLPTSAVCARCCRLWHRPGDRKQGLREICLKGLGPGSALAIFPSETICL